MSDPYYNIDIPGHFFDFMVYIELTVQFPLALYIVWSLFSRRYLSGEGEIAMVIYGTTTGICTAIVCNDMWHLGPEVITPAAKQMLLYAAYMPYAVIRKYVHHGSCTLCLFSEALFMASDASLRIIARLDDSKALKQD